MAQRAPLYQCPDCQAQLAAYHAQEESPSFCPQCQFPLMRIAGKYQLTKKLAEGGFGRVYLAEHTELQHHNERIIKIIKPELFAIKGMDQRFRNEVQITARLSTENPHIVRVYDDFGEVPKLGRFYVMEYLQGLSLRQWMQETTAPIPLADIAHLFMQLCSAIESAHEADILHRDIKPSNLIVLEQNKDPLFLKVIDFGIAKPMEQTVGPTTQGALGTPAYMAPEQYLNKRVDARTDIYAMGVLLYELLTGVPPFPYHPSDGPSNADYDDLMFAHMQQTPPSLAARCSTHPRPSALEAVVAKALAKRPKERYHSIEAFAKAFQASIAGALDEPSIPGLSTTPPPPSSPRAQHFGPTLPPSAPTPQTQEAAPVKAIPTIDRTGAADNKGTSVPPAHESLPTANSYEGPQKPPFPVGWAALFLLAIFGVGVGGVWLGAQLQLGKRGSPQALPSTQRKASTERGAGASRQVTPPEAARRTSAPGPRTKAATQPHPHRRSRKRRAVHRNVPNTSAHPVPPKSRKRRGTRIRMVSGCPRTKRYWTRIQLSPRQFRQLRPKLRKGKQMRRVPGVIHRMKGGYCVGILDPKVVVVFGSVTRGFVPCHLFPMALPSRVRILLQREGGIEPTLSHYCLRKRSRKQKPSR